MKLRILWWAAALLAVPFASRAAPVPEPVVAEMKALPVLDDQAPTIDAKAVFGAEDPDDWCPSGRPRVPWKPPRHLPWSSDLLEITDASIEPVASLDGAHEACRVTVTYENVGEDVLEAGTPLRVDLAVGGSSAGLWGPDQPFDPDNPINPYAIVHRVTLAETRLAQDVLPGETFTVKGIAHEPVGLDALDLVGVSVGEE